MQTASAQMWQGAKAPIAVSDNFRRLLKAQGTGGLQLRR